MRFLKRPQIVTLVVAIAAVVLLLLLPRTGKVEAKGESEIKSESPSDYRTVALGGLSEEEKNFNSEIEEAVSSASDPLEKIELLDSLSKFWDKKGDLMMSADGLLRIAEILQDKPGYFIAGDKYFEAFKNLSGDIQAVALKKAIECYEKVLELIPGDLEAKTSLGVCYVEGAAVLGEAPMKGIGILLEVLEKDPRNINALINLGYFAGKSGQYDKAIERYLKVLEINPDFADAYLYLSDVYLQMGNNEEAANYLEKFKRFVDDPEKLEQLNVYIEKIRNNSI